MRVTNTRLGGIGDPVKQTVFVVDDDPTMLWSLRALCTSVGLPVETYPSAYEFLAAHDGGRAGCLVLDVRLPGMSGPELQEELVARGIGLPVIMMTAYPDVAVAVCALRAGAVDFLVKPFSEQVLLERIAEALARDRDAQVLAARRSALARRRDSLTAREREVMYLVVAGKANKVIAMDLGIGEKTIEVHRAHAMRKMEVDGLAELVRAVLFLHSEPGTWRADASPEVSGNGRGTAARGGQQASPPEVVGRCPRAGSRLPAHVGRPQAASATRGKRPVKRPID